MAFELVQIENNRAGGKVKFSVALNGLLYMTAMLVKLLEIKAGDKVAIFWNSLEKAYYIGKANPIIGEGYKPRFNDSGAAYFNRKGLVAQMIERCDLALGDDKLKKVRLDVDKEVVEFDGYKLYKIY